MSSGMWSQSLSGHPVPRPQGSQLNLCRPLWALDHEEGGMEPDRVRALKASIDSDERPVPPVVPRAVCGRP